MNVIINEKNSYEKRVSLDIFVDFKRLYTYIINRYREEPLVVGTYGYPTIEYCLGHMWSDKVRYFDDDDRFLLNRLGLENEIEREFEKYLEESYGIRRD